MTNLTKFLLVVFGVIIIIFLILRQDGQQKEELETDQNMQETQVLGTEEYGRKMSFSEFLKQYQEPHSCIVSQYLDAEMTQTIEGQVFLDREKIRADFFMTNLNTPMQASILTTDGFMYSWDSNSVTGIKKTAGIEQGAEQTENQETFSWNPDWIWEYDCQLWETDETIFLVPENITFQEA